ncbi:glycosyltransferase family 2 protein [Sporolactobacillus shoreicorticis]|uniref:Glycosyltransferase family 2 protein n=1 Tax=Sporolactobacillus shoreicorticis TaxID=1923877 RepID=A0ABW5S5C9_9BACL|nr:glycosyltransferase family 2 protein [Sporolactobacillus shoreicorticis]MCO7126220.1 glycosyltransferase family 2 protein [Sporolactobacillus shoreicorticis]
MNEEPLLSIIVPCFNEEEVLPETMKVLTGILDSLSETGTISRRSFILFVDDGSSDKTWQLVSERAQTVSSIQGLRLSRNFGHQNALIAGIETVNEAADCVITIDADLQDDARAIPAFIRKYQEGFDVVYGVRKRRDQDTFFKKNSARIFYRLMAKMGVNLVPDHADFRLLSRRSVQEFMRYQEENLFIRGIIPLLSFKSAKVYYDRQKRYAGESKYPLKKMLAFAVDGITSFTIVPIKLVMNIGFLFVLIGGVIGVYALINWFLDHTISGWTSLILSIWMIGGMQLIAVGVIGEYIGKIFTETKKRPRYTIEINTLNDKN